MPKGRARAQGTEEYGPAIDCWAVGCVLGELLRGQPLFGGQTEAQTLDLIFGLLVRRPGEISHILPVWNGRKGTSLPAPGRRSRHAAARPSTQGAPSDRIWPGWQRLPKAASLQPRPQPYSFLKQHFPRIGEDGVQLLNHLLTYDPVRPNFRPSAAPPCSFLRSSAAQSP